MTEETVDRKRDYVVLRQIPEAEGNAGVVGLGRRFVEVGEPVAAANANAAIRERAGEQEGVYVAVPARSFDPVVVTVKTEKVVSLT